MEYERVVEGGLHMQWSCQAKLVILIHMRRNTEQFESYGTHDVWIGGNIFEGCQRHGVAALAGINHGTHGLGQAHQSQNHSTLKGVCALWYTRISCVGWIKIQQCSFICAKMNRISLISACTKSPRPFKNSVFKGVSTQGLIPLRLCRVVFREVLVRVSVHDGLCRVAYGERFARRLTVSVVICTSIIDEMRRLVDESSSLVEWICQGATNSSDDEEPTLESVPVAGALQKAPAKWGFNVWSWHHEQVLPTYRTGKQHRSCVRNVSA